MGVGWGRVGRRPWTTAQGLPAGPPRREAVRVDRGGQVVLSRDCSPVVKEGFAHRSHGRAVMQNRDGSARRAACSAIAALGQGSTRDEASASIPGAHDPANWRSDREAEERWTARPGARRGPMFLRGKAFARLGRCVEGRRSARRSGGRARRRAGPLHAPPLPSRPGPGGRPAARQKRSATPCHMGRRSGGEARPTRHAPRSVPAGRPNPPPGAGRGPTALRGPACPP